MGREHGSARTWLVGAALLAVGACLGIVLGSAFDAPGLLAARMTEPVQSIELEPDPQAGEEDLEQYRALQYSVDPRPLPAAAAIPPVASPPVDVPLEPAAQSRSEAPPEDRTLEPQAQSSATRQAKAPEPEPAPKPQASKPKSAGPKSAGPRAAERQAADVIGEIASRTESPTPAGLPEPVPATSATGASAPAAAGGSVIQVGAYADPKRAARVVGQLRELGFDSYVSPQVAAGPYPHRVRVRSGGGGPQAVSAKLRSHGYDVWVTRE